MKKYIGKTSAFALIILLLLPTLASAESDSSHLNRMRRDVGRQLIEVQASNWPSIMALYTDDIEYRDPVVTIAGKDTMTEFLARMFTNSPDLITTVHDETCINGIYSASWTMVGMFNGVPYSADGMSIIKFRPRETQAYFQRDYYTEGDIMINIPGLDEAVGGFRVYYRCAVDPTFDCPLDPPAGAGSKGDEIALSEKRMPAPFKLNQNYPNPFNPSTDISFEVPFGGADVSLQVYDVSGKLVRTLVNGFEASGTKTVTWDGKDDKGQDQSSGVYFYKMTAPEYSETMRMIMLK